VFKMLDITATLILGTFLISCGGPKRDAASNTGSAAPVSSPADSLAKVYGASKEFMTLMDSSPLDNIYTIDVDEALVSEDRQPVVCVGYVHDLRKRGDQFEIQIVSQFSWQGYRLILHCDNITAVKVQLGNREMFADCTVVCVVDSVKRLAFEAVGMESGELSVENSHTFVAFGSCIDLVIGKPETP